MSWHYTKLGLYQGPRWVRTKSFELRGKGYEDGSNKNVRGSPIPHGSTVHGEAYEYRAKIFLESSPQAE